MGKYFTTMKEYFPRAHIEERLGKKKHARDYIFKTGKYADKAHTRIGEVYEYGEFVDERERTDITDINQMIENGATFEEIDEAYPTQAFRYRKEIERRIQDKLERDNKNRFRKLYTAYISGDAGVGKTRFVMDTYGYTKVYRVTNYGTGMFDTYKCEDVVLFEEFRSSVQIERMLNYLDGYPIMLPARYGDKVACYTKVYIVTNIPLDAQYVNVQGTHYETYKAFLRRINEVYDFNRSKDEPISKPSGNKIKLTLVETDELPF
jgi:hypothetical protein